MITALQEMQSITDCYWHTMSDPYAHGDDVREIEGILSELDSRDPLEEIADINDRISELEMDMITYGEDRHDVQSDIELQIFDLELERENLYSAIHCN